MELLTIMKIILALAVIWFFYPFVRCSFNKECYEKNLKPFFESFKGVDKEVKK